MAGGPGRRRGWGRRGWAPGRPPSRRCRLGLAGTARSWSDRRDSGADSAPPVAEPPFSLNVTERERGGFIGRRPGTVRRRRRRWSTRAVDFARSATSRSVASYRRTRAGARASRPAAARTARSTEVGTRTPPVHRISGKHRPTPDDLSRFGLKPKILRAAANAVACSYLRLRAEAPDAGTPRRSSRPGPVQPVVARSRYQRASRPPSAATSSLVRAYPMWSRQAPSMCM